MAFNTSKVIIKVPLVLAFGTAGAMFFYSIASSLGWTIFGNIVGVVLSHCIIEVIYWGDFKKLFSHEKTLAVCLAVSLAVLLSFYFDLFKFDAYVPEESQIAYASVDFNKDSWVYSRNFDPEMGADSILYQARRWGLTPSCIRPGWKTLRMYWLWLMKPSGRWKLKRGKAIREGSDWRESIGTDSGWMCAIR